MSNDTTAAESERAPDTDREGTEPGETLDPGATPTATALQAELDRFRELAMRAQADFENFRKRAAREKEEAVKYANAAFLDRLIPVIDNFELGLTAARQDTGAKAILAGMEMVERQLQDFLRESGVEEIDATTGAVFDPNLHEAVGHEVCAEVEEGGVVRQLRKGFKLRDRLVRPSMVVVSKGGE